MTASKLCRLLGHYDLPISLLPARGAIHLALSLQELR
jgi:hypothetical protein